MNSYKFFSHLYDSLTEEMDYTTWVNEIKKTNKTNILDVGCGSATLLIILKILGFNIDGLDISSTMLDIAKKKIEMNHLSDINLYEMNMINFKLNKKYDLITCFFDTVNHLKTEEEFLSAIKNMYEHLNDDGILLFDAFTKEKMNDTINQIHDDEGPGYKAKWKIHQSNNQIIHTLNFKIASEEFTEVYEETYFDVERIIPFEYEKTKVVVDGVCERIIYKIVKR